MVCIKLLRDCPQYAPILAYWSYRQWYGKREIPFDMLIESYKKRANYDFLPITWTAIEDRIPVGMVTLKRDDLWSRKDINPWLASLYIEPEFRNRGTADMLIKAIIKRTGELGFERLYLFTGGQDQDMLERFYMKRGWKFFESAVDNDGKNTKIFYYDID